MNKNIEDMKTRILKNVSTITKYGKDEKVEITEEEFNTYTKLKIINSLDTIKKIMIFFCAVMVISLIRSLYTLFNI